MYRKKLIKAIVKGIRNAISIDGKSKFSRFVLSEEFKLGLDAFYEEYMQAYEQNRGLIDI